MYDAHITAGKMNDGTLEFRPMQMVHMVLFVAAAVFIVIACRYSYDNLISSMLSSGTSGIRFLPDVAYYGDFLNAK